MRKLFLLSVLAFSIVGVAQAQGEIDAFKLSRNDLTGTARSVSMGGAFGALGGDISAIAINPAGIGVYRSSEIVTTLNFQNTKTETELNLGKINENKFKVNFDNLAFVTTVPLNSDEVPFLNFGFSYNRLKKFDREYGTAGTNLSHSMAKYMADRANSASNITNPEVLKYTEDEEFSPFHDYDWMAVFGYNAGLIEHNSGGYHKSNQLGNISHNSLYSREKGSISSYDFNIGTNISDIVNLGLTLSVTDLKYHLYSEFDEDYGDFSNAGFTLKNEFKSEGAGFQIAAGVILKPIDELRIGLAYHSPTWYNMTDYYYADFDYNLSGIMNSNPNGGPTSAYLPTPAYRYDYKLRTPDRFTASLAGVLGQIAILSADYEYTNYGSNMRLFEDNGREMGHRPNESIEKHYKGASTIRVGGEIRFTPQFSGRVGYAWMQSPLKDNFKRGKDEAMTVGSVTQYTLDGDRNYFTYGLGYRFSRNFFADIAFVMGSQKDDLQSFYTENKAEGSTLKTTTFQGLLTLGYRF